MTNEEEAIEVLKNDIEICTFQQKDAVELAIEALEQRIRMRDAIKTTLSIRQCNECYEMRDAIKTTLSEINDIHERIRQCNERYEKRMKELERPVEFYDINGPLKITREEDNNG